MKPLLKSAACILLTGIAFFLSCNKETSCESCRENNKPPIALAGPDQVITLPTDSVSLDGRNSSDPDGTISEWLWTKISGPASGNIIKPDLSKTLVKALAMGVYQFELKVTDNGGLSARDTVQIIVEKPASIGSSIANAGPNQTLTLPLDSAYLDGSGSALNGWSTTPATFVWTRISGPPASISPVILVLTAPALIPTTAIAKNLIPGTYLFRLKVTNPSGASDADTVQVNVVDNPLDKNTVTFHDLRWQVGDVYGLAEIDNFLNTSLRTDIFYSYSSIKPVQVYYKSDNIPSWISVSYRAGGFYYDGNGDFLWIVNYPVDPSLAGRKSSIKIKLL